MKVIKAIIIISRGGKFTREKAVDNGVYCVNRLTRGLLIDEICGNDYEKNGFGEKRGKVRLSRLSGRRMNERYGARVGKAEISRGFKKERESAGVERTRVGSEFVKQHKDCGTSGKFSAYLLLNCEGLSEFNLHSAVSSCVALSSCVAIPYCVVLRATVYAHNF